MISTTVTLVIYFWIETIIFSQVFVQEKHSLKLKLEASINTEKSLQYELESVREQSKIKYDQLKKDSSDALDAQIKASTKKVSYIFSWKTLLWLLVDSETEFILEIDIILTICWS